MIMIDDLKTVLDDIEKKDDWTYRFVTDIATRLEENPDYKLTGKQFRKLCQVHHDFYYYFRSRR